MMELCDSSKCVGCGICALRCPSNAIAMVTDSNGFSYPLLNQQLCIDCGTCRSVCPVLSGSDTSENYLPFGVFACWNRHIEIRLASSSGGIFSVLADTILSKGGVVYGAVFDASLKVTIIRTEHRFEVEKMRGSKYIEADLGNVFKMVAHDIREGKTILFSGTPCQNAALRRYLLSEQIDYEISPLYQVDFICHGVSSPALWKSFISAIEKKYRSKLNYVYFRDKSIGGWKSPAMRFTFLDRKDIFTSWSTPVLRLENAFISCYHKNITLRRSCYSCRFRKLPRSSDVTLADAQALYHRSSFHREARAGISFVLINSVKGKRLFEESSEDITLQPRPFFEMGIPGQTIPLPPLREIFLKEAATLDFFSLFQKYRSHISSPFRFGTFLNAFLKMVFGARITLKIRETGSFVYNRIFGRDR